MQAEVSLVRVAWLSEAVYWIAHARANWKWLEREISAPFFFNKFLRNVELVIAFFNVVAPKRAVCL